MRKILRSYRPLTVDPPLVNASGILSFLDVFELLERKGIALGAFVTKSIGPVATEGNVNPVIYDTGAVMLNSLALPTQSPAEWVEELKACRLTRPLIISVYGGSAEEFAQVVRAVEPYAAGIELNLGCPNAVPGEESIMVELGQDPAAVRATVAAARAETDKPLIAKLSPNSDYVTIARVAEEAGADYLALANTVGPGLAIDIWSAQPFLAGHSGGLSGGAIKPLVVRMVYETYKVVHIPIVAYGGIATWEDVIEYALAGASIFGLGTCYSYLTTDEVVDLTARIWEGVKRFLSGRKLDEIVGGAHG